MTDKFLSEEELRLLVNNDKLFEYYDLKNIYLGTSGDNIKRCYDCQIILDRSEKYRCKEHAKIYSKEQGRQYKNKYSTFTFLAVNQNLKNSGQEKSDFL